MDVRRYWICRQEHGLLTPFKCRSENQVSTLLVRKKSTLYAGDILFLKIQSIGTPLGKYP